jgi:predicted membrane-bound spermidine synthase
MLLAVTDAQLRQLKVHDRLIDRGENSPIQDCSTYQDQAGYSTEEVAFYINGDLQFDSQDEAIYHEHLVGPAIALATVRFPQQPLRGLICGGGDGLAARDALRFTAVDTVTIVDYDAAVLQLAHGKASPSTPKILSTLIIGVMRSVRRSTIGKHLA